MSSSQICHQVQYGDSIIQYELTYAPRKTLAISVHPDLRVTVKAPEGSDFELIEKRIRKRAAWILKQQRDLERYLPGLPPRRYVSGETHRYLGRQYRLKVVQSATSYELVKMSRGHIMVHAQDNNDRERIKQLLNAWYRKQAKRVFQERLDVCYLRAEKLGIEYPNLVLRVMKTRWGSCTPSGKILLNPKLIQMPKDCIDYVIVHELCHLREHNHSREFYALLDHVMPNWREIKRKLEEH